MEEDVGLVVLEHLRNKLDVHVLNVDLLEDVLVSGAGSRMTGPDL